MRFQSILYLLLLLFFSHTGVAQSPVLNEIPLSKGDRWDFYLAEDGGGWLAYYTPDSALRLRAPDGKEIVMGPDHRPQAPSGLAILPGIDGAALSWRDKYPKKGLYFQPGPDALALNLGTDTEALSRIRMARVGDRVHLLWYGEKFDPETKETYNLFYRSIDPDGKNPGPLQRLMGGIYPIWLVDGEEIAVFSERWRPVGGEERFLAVQKINPETGLFGSPIKIPANSAGFGPTHRAFASAGRWFLLWTGHDDKNQMALQGIFSDDKGQTWKQFLFEDIVGIDTGRFDVEVDGKGHIAIAMSGAYPGQPLKGKENAYLIRSEDNGTTWSKAHPLRPTALIGYRGRLPSLAFGNNPGELLVVWEDWRDIRGNVYAALSADYGKSWVVNGVSLTDGSANYGLPFWTKAVRPLEGGYVVVAERYRGDGMRQKDLVEFRLDAAGLTKLAADKKGGVQPEGATEERLRERVEAFWKAMEAEDYKTAYGFYDPYYRGNVSEEIFLSRTGMIKYHSHKLEEVRFEGRLAGIKTTIEAAVPEVEIDGAKIKKDKKEIPFMDLWVFIDGEWYREYYDEGNSKTFTRY